MDCHMSGAMLDLLEAYCKLKTKPKTTTELKEALQVIWGNLTFDKAVKDFSKRLKACFGDGSGHFEHSQ